MTTTDSPQSPDGREARADSSDSPVFVYDGPGDTTRRPAPPNLPPPGWYGRQAADRQRRSPDKS